MRVSVLIILSGALNFAVAQPVKVVKYYDSSWIETPKTKAIFSAEFVRQNNVYQVTSYRIKTKTLESTSTFADTNFKKGIGVQKTYNTKGILIDSSLFNDTGRISKAYHFYDNGKPYYQWFVDSSKNIVSHGFDTNGNEIEDFIYYRQSEFSGGLKKWQNYIERRMSGFHHTQKIKESFSSMVLIIFAVDTNGSITDAAVWKSSGIDEFDKYALRAVQQSPQWEPAIHLNKPSKEYRTQPFTCIFSPN